MTKKDYELVARTLKDRLYSLNGEDSYLTIARMELRGSVSALSAAFMADNPRFDPDKFTRACGF